MTTAERSFRRQWQGRHEVSGESTLRHRAGDTTDMCAWRREALRSLLVAMRNERRVQA